MRDVRISRKDHRLGQGIPRDRNQARGMRSVRLFRKDHQLLEGLREKFKRVEETKEDQGFPKEGRVHEERQGKLNLSKGKNGVQRFQRVHQSLDCLQENVHRPKDQVAGRPFPNEGRSQ